MKRILHLEKQTNEKTQQQTKRVDRTEKIYGSGNIRGRE